MADAAAFANDVEKSGRLLTGFTGLGGAIWHAVNMIEENGLQGRRKTIEEQLAREELSPVTLLESLDEQVTAESWEEQLAQVERRITRLGPINLAAIDEYDQQSERKTYLDAQHADLHLPVNIDREACPLNLAPTASTTATLAMGDALAMALIELKGFTDEDFARLHPGGDLGRKLLRVRELMRRVYAEAVRPEPAEAIAMPRRGR